MFGKMKWLLILIPGFIEPVYAICLKNNTDINLAYTIINKNFEPNRPKVGYYEGMITKETKCFAHTKGEDDYWGYYRKDEIVIEKIENGQKKLVCKKRVEGILNTMRISYFDFNHNWFCLDRQDDET